MTITKVRMSKRKKSSTMTATVKVEVKEENIYGDELLLARGRLKNVLRNLIQQSEDEFDTSEEESRKLRNRISRKKENKGKRRKNDTPPVGSFHHTYVMKLFDRSVDLARFEEDTPLYPICRAWMTNAPRNPQIVVKRRVSTDENDFKIPVDKIKDIYALPPPKQSFSGRIPDPLPEHVVKSKQEINFDYDEQPPTPKEELLKEHLKRWISVKKQWIAKANENEERFDPSFQMLSKIYNKAQESME